MFVTKNLKCYKMANNGWISIVKVSIGAYGYSASNLLIFNDWNLFQPKFIYYIACFWYGNSYFYCC